MTLKDADRVGRVCGTVWYRGAPYTVYAIGKRYVKKDWAYPYIELLDRNGRSIVSAKPDEVSETPPIAEENNKQNEGSDNNG